VPSSLIRDGLVRGTLDGARGERDREPIFERVAHDGGVGQSIRWVFCEQFGEQLVERREFCAQERGLGDRGLCVLPQELFELATGVGRLVGEQVIREAAEGVEVLRGGGLGGEKRLGREIPWRPNDLVALVAERGGAEIDEHRASRVIFDDDVVRLHVAMDDADLVDRAQRIAQITEDLRRAPDRDEHVVVRRVLANDRCEVHPDDELHREVRDLLVQTERVHVHDVLVAHGGERSGFAAKALSIVRVLSSQELERARPLEVDVDGSVEHAHAAAADFFFDLEAAVDEGLGLEDRDRACLVNGHDHPA
jgi:hypothetical protein